MISWQSSEIVSITCFSRKSLQDWRLSINPDF